jgi:hypothetical protein
LKTLIVCAIAALVFVVSIVFMPWSELGFTGNFPTWLNWLMQPLGVDKLFNEMLPIGNQIRDFLKNAGATKNFGDYAYSLFIGFALTAAAIAIILVGKEDAEEKTILPLKK